MFFYQAIIFLKIDTEMVAVTVVAEMAAAAAQGLGFSYFLFSLGLKSRVSFLIDFFLL